MVGRSLDDRQGTMTQELRFLDGHSDEESQRRRIEMEAEFNRLEELRLPLLRKARELREALPFDTLLSLQCISPELFRRRGARASVTAQAWRALWGEEEDLTLSDTVRTSFRRDFTPHPLLDEAG